MYLITPPSYLLKIEIPMINIMTEVMNAIGIVCIGIGISSPSRPYLNMVRNTAIGFIVRYNSNHLSGILSIVHRTGD